MRLVVSALVGPATLAATPLAAEPLGSGRPSLEALVAKADATDPDTDPAGYLANYRAALAETRRHYADDSAQVAVIQLGVARALAAQQKLDEASALLEAHFAAIEKAQPAFRASLGEAYNLRGYIAVFRGDHAAAVPAMERALEIQRSITGDRPNVETAKSLANLGAIYREAGRPADALRLNGEALAMLPALDPPPPDAALWYGNRTVYLRELGRDEEAVQVSYDGLAFAEKAFPAGHPLLATLYANLSMLLIRQGRPNAAVPLASKAVGLVENVAGPTQNSAAMRAILATAMVGAGRNAEGVTFLREAIPIIDAQLGPTSNRALAARELLARALMLSGQLDEARTIQLGVLAAGDERLPANHIDRMEARMVLGSIELARGKNAAAVAALREGVALRAAAMPASHPDLLTERALLLLARSRAGETGLAAEGRTLLDQLKTEAARSTGDTLTSAVRSAFGFLAEALARSGDTDAAFEAQQWSARTSVDDAAIAAAFARAEADSAIASLIPERRRAVAARGAELGAVDGQLANPRDGFDLAAANARLATLDAAIGDIEERLVAAGSPLPRFAAPSTAEVRGRLASDEAFVQVSEVRDGALVTAIAREGTWQHLVRRSEADLHSLAERLRTTLDPLTAASRPFDRGAATAIYAALIRPEFADALKSKKRLAVSANGPLGAVPFAVLAPAGKGSAYLIDRIAIVRLPGAPRAAIAKSQQPLSPRIVGVGDVGRAGQAPALAMRGGYALDIESLPALPEAADELADLARAVGATDPVLLTGDGATEAALRATRVTPGSVLAFATHGLVSGEVEGLRQPALLLSAEGADDGLLTASEIAAMDWPARWVLLSACNTAAGAGPDAPGLSGLAQAFIMAGADRILATHWPVRDDVARAVATGTLRFAANGVEPAEALRRAILAARSSKAPLADHPALWGPFELVE